MCYSRETAVADQSKGAAMGDAIRVIRFSFRDLWDEFVMLALFNVVWSLSAVLPILPLLAFRTLDLRLLLAMDLVLALPLPIVSGGLAFATNQVSRGKTIGWDVFFSGVRRYWVKSLAVAVVNVLALILISANLEFYGVLVQGSWTVVAVSIWLVLGVYWLLTQMFWFPMILELESEQVFVALRHALVMVVVTPLFSLTCGIAMLILGLLCLLLSVPAVFMMGALLLLIANHATRSRLAYAHKEPYEPGIYAEAQKRAR